MVSCSAYKCHNRTIPGKKRSFYFFPLNDPARLKKWMLAVRRHDWTPTKWSTLCDEHFEPSAFLLRPNAYCKKLRPDAIPTIFNFCRPGLLASKKERERLAVTTDVNVPEIDPVPEPKHKTVEVQTTKPEVMQREVQVNLPTPDLLILRAEIKQLKAKIARRDVKIKSQNQIIQDWEDHHPCHFGDDTIYMFERK